MSRARDFDTYYTCRLNVDEDSDKKTLLPLVAIMRGPRNFCRGGGVQARRPENSLDNVFILVLNLFYSLQRGSNGFTEFQLD